MLFEPPSILRVTSGRGLLLAQVRFDKGYVEVGYVRLSLLQFATHFDFTPTQLTNDSLALLREQILATNSKVEVLILDWSGISHGDERTFEELVTFVSSIKAVVNISVTAAIAGSLNLRWKNFTKNVQSQESLDNLPPAFPFSDLVRSTEQFNDRTETKVSIESNECIIWTEKKQLGSINRFLDAICSSKDSMASLVGQAENSVLEQCAASCFVEKPQYLRSTPLWSNGFFDAQKLIGDPNIFPWVAFKMARLVRGIQQIVKIDSNGLRKQLRLLACTQNGATLAVAISHMFAGEVVPGGENLDPLGVDIIDRFGPSEMFIEEYCSDELSTPSCYVFIGDFVIAGTELKIAEVHSYHRRALLRHAVVIGSVLPPADAAENAVNSVERPARQLLKRISLQPLVNVSTLTKEDGEKISPEYIFPKPSVSN